MNPAGPNNSRSTEAVHDAGGHVAELTFPGGAAGGQESRWHVPLGFIKSYADLKGLRTHADQAQRGHGRPAYRESIEA